MKPLYKFLFILTGAMIFGFTKSYNQLKFQLSGGLSANKFQNTAPKGSPQFSYPISIGYEIFGSCDIPILPKTFLVAGIGYMNKGLKIKYGFEEQDIPYKTNDIYVERYSIPFLSLGLKYFIRQNLFLVGTNIGIGTFSASETSGRFSSDIPNGIVLSEKFDYQYDLGARKMFYSMKAGYQRQLAINGRHQLGLELEFAFNKLAPSRLEYNYSYQNQSLTRITNNDGYLHSLKLLYTYTIFEKH